MRRARECGGDCPARVSGGAVSYTWIAVTTWFSLSRTSINESRSGHAAGSVDQGDRHARFVLHGLKHDVRADIDHTGRLVQLAQDEVRVVLEIVCKHPQHVMGVTGHDKRTDHFRPFPYGGGEFLVPVFLVVAHGNMDERFKLNT